MGMQKKATSVSDVDADMSSTDSLSFAGLVCIQDQQQHLMKPHQTSQALSLPPPAAKHDPEFEFISHSSSTRSSATGSSPRRVSPADLLFSNGQLLPQAIPSPFPFPSHSDHSVPSHTRTRRSRSSSSSSRRRASESELGSSSKAAAAKKKPDNSQVRNFGASCHNNNNNKDESFGKKIFKSISAPCRGCRALEPSKSIRSAQTLSQ